MKCVDCFILEQSNLIYFLWFGQLCKFNLYSRSFLFFELTVGLWRWLYESSWTLWEGTAEEDEHEMTLEITAFSCAPQSWRILRWWGNVGRMEHPWDAKVQSSILCCRWALEVREGTFTVGFLSVLTVPGLLACCHCFLFAGFIVVVCCGTRLESKVFQARNLELAMLGTGKVITGQKGPLAPESGLLLASKDSMARLLPLLSFPFWFSTLLTLQVGSP